MLITAVHMPPDADTKAALSILYSSINDQRTLHPDGVFIVAGDFNQAVNQAGEGMAGGSSVSTTRRF